MSFELIETMLIEADRSVPLLSRHLDRLAATCSALDYPWAGAPQIEQEVAQAITALAHPGPHRLRLLLDRAGRRTIQTAPLGPLVGPQTIMLADTALNADEPLLRYKTTCRPWYSDTTHWLAEHPEVFDLVYLNERGELCEGSRTNIYLHQRGVWCTPPLASGCLPGVQRADLLDRGLVHERVLTLHDLHHADEIRVSNALRGWFDVTLRRA